MRREGEKQQQQPDTGRFCVVTVKSAKRAVKASSATTSIEIDAPVEEVFAFVADPVQTMDAMETLGRVVVSDVETTPQGAVWSWKWTERFRLVPFNVHAKVTRLEQTPNQRIVEKHSTGPVCTYSLEPSGDGTRLTYTIELTRPRALLTQVQAFITTKGKGVESDMDKFLVAIKQRLEA
jgi:carbon monoxide dehydrogenase subunit G